MKEINNQKCNKERGQIIVLLAISLLVLMFVAALAVDGGMIYSERRFAQNAADASSLAGGGAVLNYMETKITVDGVDDYQLKESDFNNCDDQLIKDAIADSIEAAKTVAANNNFPGLPYLGLMKFENISGVWKWTGVPNEEIINAPHGIVIYCNPKDSYIDTQVKITTKVSTSFAHLIFPGDLVTTNIAVTRARPRYQLGLGNGIISLSDKCQNNTDGMAYTGTGTINVFGGGVHSNSCLIANGNVTVKSNDGGITLIDENGATLNGGALLSPPATVVDTPFEIEELPKEPICSKDGELKNGTYTEGNYPSGIKITTGTYKFDPGIYCLKGNLEITGGTVRGYNLTFFMDEGNVKITGNTDVRLTATYDNPNTAMIGLLIYMAEDNPGLITLVGTDKSLFTGTILAPTGNIEAGGTSDGVSLDELGCEGDDVCIGSSFNVQLIGWYVKVVGTSALDVYFDESLANYVVGKLHLLK